MDKLKLLNLFLMAFLVSILVQYWFFPKPNTSPVIPTDIFLSVEKDALVIPNIPKVQVHNSTTGSIMIHTCRDIIISWNSQPITTLEKDAPSFCQEISVTPNSVVVIPFNALYKLFALNSGTYTLHLKTGFGDRVVSFSTTEPGMFRTLASRLIYEPIYNFFVALLMWIPGHSLGWAIVIITFIIRLILLVPQQHMLESQKKLQKIQPRIKAIQKEFKDDQMILGQKMMELYKTEGVNPMGSCLPLLIQMPILIGLYWVISGITDSSNFYHLYSIFQNFNPLSIDTHFFGINLSQVGGYMAIILGAILGITQWIQAYMSFQHTKKTKASEAKKDLDIQSPEAILDPEMMQKMMLYMLPIMLAVSAYFFPLGVGLYWFIGTLFVIGQQWYVNRKGI